MAPAAAPRDARVFGALLAVQVLFGTLSVAGKVVFHDIPPGAVAAIRIASAAVILVALERWLVPREAARPRGRDLAALAGLSLLGVVLNQYLFLKGLALTTAVNATLLVTTIPPFTLLVALTLGRERFGWGKLGGIALAFSGVALLLGVDALAFGGQNLLGNALVTTNAFLYSVYLVLSRPLLMKFDPLVIVVRTFAWGALFMGIIGLPDLLATDFGSVSRDGWLALAWIVLGPTVGTYSLNNWVLRYLDSSTVAAFIPLQPLVAALLAVPFLGERIGWETALAGALILGGVVIAARGARSRRAGKPI